MDVTGRIAAELSLPKKGVGAVVALLEGGNTVPFIARYRKEATGGLDEVQIREIEERRGYLDELEKRRKTILDAIEAQGALTDALRRKIEEAESKTALEDLYLPYKKKRKTRASKAREQGLEPLAALILGQSKSEDRSRYSEEDLAGARDIVAEDLSETPAIRADVRRLLETEGLLVSRAARGKKKERSQFEDYYDHREPAKRVPSHRYLAMRRGEREGFLRVAIEVDPDRAAALVRRHVRLDRGSPFHADLELAIADGLKRLLLPSLENELRAELKERADREAVDVFATNLRRLLLAAPFGTQPVLGLDPGLRTGCKVAVLDRTGTFVENATLFLSGSGKQRAEGAAVLERLLRKHQPKAIAIGNGTGSREAEAFVRKVLDVAKLADAILVVQVSEAGASVYSASEIARREFPDLDLTVRGAISIGRRLQDPLAELVKLDPKAIGVGQYQHDVHQPLLAKQLHAVVESCVNHVGVELNTASASLLTHVAGIGPTLAERIVTHRGERGPFSRRKDLLKVSGLGPKAFEQAAGFLRIRDGVDPLDASAVHPEQYALVNRIARDLGTTPKALVAAPSALARLDRARYEGEVGAMTLADIIAELEKPGRDPREDFAPPRFRDDVAEISDLEPGMKLEGVVTNVAAFGAVVDVGVHQDGLVHVSQLANRFVKDPNEVVHVGQKVKVRVLDVDLERRRISLTMK